MLTLQLLVSCLTLTAIAVERFIAIVCPLRHHTLSTTRNACLVIALCWVYAMLVGALPLFGWNVIKDDVIERKWQPETEQCQRQSTVSGAVSPLPIGISATADLYDDNGGGSVAMSTTTRQVDVPVLPVHECRYDTVVGGSFVAFMYPGHFVPLWFVMVFIYGQIYMRSRGQRPSVSRLNSSVGGRAVALQSTNATASIYRRNVRRWSATRGRFDGEAFGGCGGARADGTGRQQRRSRDGPGSSMASVAAATAGGRSGIGSSIGSRWMPRSSENWRALRILTVLVGYFMFSWLPVVVWYSTLYRGFTIEDVRRMDPVLPAWFYNVSITLAYGNSAVNPFLYGFGNRSIRRCLTQTVRRLFQCPLCGFRRSRPESPPPVVAARPVNPPPEQVFVGGRSSGGRAAKTERCSGAGRAPVSLMPGPSSSTVAAAAAFRGGFRATGACCSEMQLVDDRRVVVAEVQHDSCV